MGIFPYWVCGYNKTLLLNLPHLLCLFLLNMTILSLFL
ncbi:hypothetical protein AO375_0859 [Moraxella catarrhalis]|nr:hypothetical protein AO375_0859 [Moraxella catarrhalis]